MQLHKRFESELIRRFLVELKEDERLALGVPPKISIIFVDGSMVLHIEPQCEAHWWALLLSDRVYVRAAYYAGFDYVSIFPGKEIGFAYTCHP